MNYAMRPYGNHDIVQRYCRHIDDNVVVQMGDGRKPDSYRCLTPYRCGGRENCRWRATLASEAESGDTAVKD